MKTGIKVLDAMTNKPIIANSDLSAVECAKLMRKFHVGSLLIKEESEVMGIITEQDFVTKIIAKGLDSNDITARDLMEKNLVTIAPEKDIYDAMVEMRNNDIRRLPVKSDGKIIGYLTMKDIVKIEPQLFDLMVENFNLREEDTKPIIAGKPIEEGMCESCGNFSYRLTSDSGVKLCSQCRSS